LAPPHNPNRPRGVWRIDRTFLPIPLLRWERHSLLFSPRGFIAVNPSIVIGRRLTFAPNLLRGGCTVGVALQMKIGFNQAGPPASEAGTAQPGTAILSKLRGILARNAG
jgi:hypothetical protein